MLGKEQQGANSLVFGRSRFAFSLRRLDNQNFASFSQIAYLFLGIFDCRTLLVILNL